MTEEIIEDEPVVEVPYGDLYLKFPDEATANAMLYEEFPLRLDDDLNVLETYEAPRYEGMSIDTLGIIYNVDNTDPENPVYTPQDGWHVNTRGPMPEELVPFEVFPVLPRRVWA